LGRDDIVTGRRGLAKQSNRRVVFADFRAGRPENLYAKIATRLYFVLGVQNMFWTPTFRIKNT